MKKTLTDAEKLELIPRILKVIKTGKPWKDGNMHHPARLIIAAVSEIQSVKKKSIDSDAHGFVTNGWQFDWWQEFTRDGTNYTLSGSGYYGGHSFQISDEL